MFLWRFPFSLSRFLLLLVALHRTATPHSPGPFARSDPHRLVAAFSSLLLKVNNVASPSNNALPLLRQSTLQTASATPIHSTTCHIYPLIPTRRLHGAPKRTLSPCNAERNYKKRHVQLRGACEQIGLRPCCRFGCPPLPSTHHLHTILADSYPSVPRTALFSVVCVECSPLL